jgi:hypothetical protein
MDTFFNTNMENYIVILTDNLGNELPIGFYDNLSKAKYDIMIQMDMINDMRHKNRIYTNGIHILQSTVIYLDYKIYKYDINNMLIIPTVFGNIDLYRNMKLIFIMKLI